MGQSLPASQPGFGARVPVTRRIERGGPRGGAQSQGGAAWASGSSPLGTNWRVGTPSDAQRAQGRTASGKSRALSGESPARRPHAGGATVGAVAFAQMVASLAWTALALVIWYFAMPSATRLTMFALCGAVIAAGSALSMELARGARGTRLRVARLLLPVVDFIAAAGAFWLLAGDSSALLLWLVPTWLATVLIGWRVGTIAAAASELAAVAMWLALGGAPGGAWLVGALQLALVLALVVGGLAAYARHVQGARADLLARLRQAESRRESAEGDCARLRDGVRLLERTQVRLEQERQTLDRQTSEMAHIVRRLADGDRQGARQRLTQVMAASGPIGQALADLAVGLNWLAHQEPTPAIPDQYVLRQLRQAQGVSQLLGEQTRLLNATDLALSDQAAVANQLVSAIQLLAHGAGGAAGQPEGDRQQIYRTIHEIEQVALGHASSTAMLGARMAQMRQRQNELDAHMRGLASAVQAAPLGGNLGGKSNPGSAGMFGHDALASTSQPWAY